MRQSIVNVYKIHELPKKIKKENIAKIRNDIFMKTDIYSDYFNYVIYENFDVRENVIAFNYTRQHFLHAKNEVNGYIKLFKLLDVIPNVEIDKSKLNSNVYVNFSIKIDYPNFFHIDYNKKRIVKSEFKKDYVVHVSNILEKVFNSNAFNENSEIRAFFKKISNVCFDFVSDEKIINYSNHCGYEFTDSGRLYTF